MQTCVVTGDFNAGNMKIVCKPPDPPVSSMFGGGGGGGAATAKLVMAYVMYGLLNGLITLTQADIDATSKPEPDPPEAMAPDDIARMEAECTIMWQPPLWWDQQPMWMSRPPPWLNDVEVRDETSGHVIANLDKKTPTPGDNFTLAEQLFSTIRRRPN